LVLGALLLFLVPDAQVNLLRGRVLSVLSPVLKVCGSARKPALEPALIAVPASKPVEIPKSPAASGPNLIPALDSMMSELAQKNDEIAKLKAELGARDSSVKLPPTIAADVI